MNDSIMIAIMSLQTKDFCYDHEDDEYIYFVNDLTGEEEKIEN